MNGIHDMGGMDGFGKVDPEPDEPTFHAPWEGRVIAMMRAMGAAGAWNLDMFRAERERQPPAVYLASSYYKSWGLNVEALALKFGYVTPEELAGGHALYPGMPLPRGVLRSEGVPAALRRALYERAAASPPLFKAGDPVRTRTMHPATHTRLPRYARGKIGAVERVLGHQVFPDSSALGKGENPQWLYTIVFEGRELWGPDTDADLKVSIDAFEPYLERT